MRAGVAAVMVAVVMLLLPAAGAQGADTTCQFALTRLDATTTNVLAVDTNAVYWGGTYAALPGTRIRIDGQYPHARYISWNVYDAAGNAIDESFTSSPEGFDSVQAREPLEFPKQSA